jgi:pyruvate dehydrogenase E2 component (dihydrolipoamide acetyltransferase)
MPALSPTMEAGTISSWNVSEGQAFSAGDSLAEIETDKASIDFEAQDDGVVAKIFVEAGSAEVPVGKTIMITVEDEDDVAAFKDYEPPADEEVETPEVKPEPAIELEPVAFAPVEAPEPVVQTPAPAAIFIPEPTPVIVEPAVLHTESVPTVGPSWGTFAKVKSPLASTLSADQKKYIELYGSTGQTPL